MKPPLITGAVRLARRAKGIVIDEFHRMRSGYAERAAIAASLARIEQRLASIEGFVVDDSTPLGSRVCGAADFGRPSFATWCAHLGEPPLLRRKLWEFWFIARALDERGLLQPGRIGVGFGVGREPLTAAFAARGCSITATDQEDRVASGWATTGQWSGKVDDLRRDTICPVDILRSRVRFRAVDMNDIPGDLGPADFVWSACSLEHLGSIPLGLAFIRHSLDVLRSGGVAVHTTEFNLSSPDETLESGGTVLFRRRDLDAFVAEMQAAGHKVSSIVVPAQAGIADGFVDVAPYRDEPHLRLRLKDFVTTSVGLIIEKA